MTICVDTKKQCSTTADQRDNYSTYFCQLFSINLTCIEVAAAAADIQDYIFFPFSNKMFLT